MRLLSKARFGSFLVYAPSASGELANRSRGVRDDVKFDRNGVIALAARRIAERWDALGLGDFLGPDFLLVPAPRSSPFKDPKTLWPPRRICDELVERELGIASHPLLVRDRAVPKVAFSAPAKRPTAQEHFDSMRIADPRVSRNHGRRRLRDDRSNASCSSVSSLNGLQRRSHSVLRPGSYPQRGGRRNARADLTLHGPDHTRRLARRPAARPAGR